MTSTQEAEETKVPRLSMDRRGGNSAPRSHAAGIEAWSINWE